MPTFMLHILGCADEIRHAAETEAAAADDGPEAVSLSALLHFDCGKVGLDGGETYWVVFPE